MHLSWRLYRRPARALSSKLQQALSTGTDAGKRGYQRGYGFPCFGCLGVRHGNRPHGRWGLDHFIGAQGMKVLMRQRDLSDEYILFAQQIGADGIDIHNWESVPGCVEQGYPDREGLGAIVQKLRQAGLGLFRVAPCEPLRYLRGEAGGEEEVDNLVKTIQVFGALGIPFMSVPIHLINPGHRGGMRHVHRGGYTMHGFEVEKMEKSLAAEPLQEKVTIDEWWGRCLLSRGNG